MPNRAQKLTVFLALIAAVLSLTAVVIRVVRDGVVDATPLFGGLLMLALGVGGYRRLRARPPDLH
jgi:hypothetical protein